ncbi:MAG: VPLPA-CTERM sorting domain-containing protein [Desulfobacteraceae bacterium]|nr:VPLPA-CTERM sorting domain-containing protein [Desulfobacteraceae bacterium]
MAVRCGQVSAIPVPGAVWLLGSGLFGLTGLRRKQ